MQRWFQTETGRAVAYDDGTVDGTGALPERLAPPNAVEARDATGRPVAPAHGSQAWDPVAGAWVGEVPADEEGPDESAVAREYLRTQSGLADSDFEDQWRAARARARDLVARRGA